MPIKTAVATDRSGPRERIWLLVNLCFVAIAALIVATVGINLQPAFDDSAQYRQAARNVVTLGDPYATTQPMDYSTPPYPNPPLLAYLLVPLLPLGEAGGRFAWFLLNVAAFVALYLVSLRLADPPGARYYWGVLLCALAFAPPTYLCLLYGQLGIFLALMLVAGFAVAERRPAVAGAGLGFAAVLKLYPGLPIVFYVLRRNWQVVVWSMASAVVLLALPVVFHGPEPYRSYVDRVLFGGFYPYAAEFNVSVLGFWRRLLTESGTRFAQLADAPLLAYALTGVSAVAVLTLSVRSSFAPGRRGALVGFSSWICATLLLSPVNGYYNLAGLTLPLLVLISGLAHYRSPWLSGATLLSTALITLPPSWYAPWPTLGEQLVRGWGLIALVPSLFGLIGYLILLALLARKITNNR